MISQRIAKVSLIFNGILTLACMGLLIYALVFKTRADMYKIMAEKNMEVADSVVVMAKKQRDMAEKQRQIADSLMNEAIPRGELSIKKTNNLK